MTNAPERIWIEDEFGDGDDDQWTYGTWDVRNYRDYVVEYVRADIVQALTAELASADAMIEAQAKDHASNNIRFAEATHRAEAAEAERDRLESAIKELQTFATSLAGKAAESFALKAKLSTDSTRHREPLEPVTARAAQVLLDAMTAQIIDPFDATDIEIERMALEHAGRSVDPVITLETAEKFMLAALRAIATEGQQP